MSSGKKKRGRECVWYEMHIAGCTLGRCALLTACSCAVVEGSQASQSWSHVVQMHLDIVSPLSVCALLGLTSPKSCDFAGTRS